MHIAATIKKELKSMGCKIRKWQGENDPLYEEGWIIIPGGLRPIIPKPTQKQKKKPPGNTNPIPSRRK